MASKLQAYAQMADHAAHQITGSYQEWTAFLSTAGRLYKYPYPEQLLIHAQRPNATACAEYDFWNQRMRRYVRRGATGIAIIDNSGSRPFLRYVFDVADTGGGEETRPKLWKYREEYQDTVSAALEQRFDVSGNDLVEQFERIAAQLAAEYWDDHQQDILRIVDGSFLEEYDEFNIGAQFRNAAAVSIAYTLMSRCGLEPENYFEHEDFLSIFDFNTQDTITELGTAVSLGSETVLRQIEVTIKKYEREKSAERNAEHGEQSDLHPSGRLPDSQSGPAGAAGPGPWQVREDAPDVSEGASSGTVQPPDAERDTVQPPVGDRGRGEQPSGADDAAVGEGGGGHGAVESQRSDEVGGTDEHLQGTGGGSYHVGADLQLSFMPPEIPSQREQMETIREAESADAPSASSISQAEIDTILRQYSGRLRIFTMYQRNISAKDAVAALKQEYGYSGGNHTFLDGASGITDYRPDTGLRLVRYHPRTEVTVKWPAVEKRIRQLIQEGSYLTPEELEKYQSDHLEQLPALEITQADIDAQLRFEAPLHFQNLRIYEIYQQNLSVEDTVGAVSAAFGRVAAGHKLPDGTQGWVDYRPDVGITIQKNGEDKETAEVTISWSDAEKRLRQLIEEGRYLTPEELEQYRQTHPEQTQTALAPEMERPTHIPGATPPIPATIPPREITQADIDAALQEWNGDIASKRRVQQYMTGHARDRDTAEWLKNEYGDSLPAFPVTVEGAATDLPWTKVQRCLARLVKEDRFFTEEELDNFEDIDAAAIREHLEQDSPSEFVEQVMADVERLAGQDSGTAPTIRETYDRYKPIIRDLVLADVAYQNACKNSDRENAIIEGDAAVKRAALTITEPEFMRLYHDMPDFRYRLHREIVDETYATLTQPQQEQQTVPPHAMPDTTGYEEETPPWGTEIGDHSPWGKVQMSDQFADGVYEVSTARHGGIMIRETDARILLSPGTLAAGGSEHGWRYYEEDEAAPIVIRELLEKGIPASPPYVRCEYSETRHFKADQIYSINEFDRLMKQADDEHTKGKAAALKKYGTEEKWFAAHDPELDRFIGYDKVSFCVVLPDGKRIWTRQDVGDGYGGLLNYLSQNEKYRDIVPVLQQAAEREQARLAAEVAPPDISVSDEDWQTIQGVIGAADQPPHDPLAPAYNPGDTVYLNNTAFEITGIGLLDVELRDPALPIPPFPHRE